MRQKDFYDIDITERLLGEGFDHDKDGFMFHSVDDAYKCGQCDSILKWKPSTMNTVDFRVVIPTRGNQCLLYTMGQSKPFSSIKLNNEISHLNQRIIECRWWCNKWEFVRQRTDKSAPNHIRNVMAICESMERPVTKEYLIQFIQNVLKSTGS